MIKEVIHIGITVSDMERSSAFYKDFLGLTFQGELLMEGPETDALYGQKGVTLKIRYFNGSEDMMAPPIELLQFVTPKSLLIQEQGNIFATSISEICFKVKDIEGWYTKCQEAGVPCLSEPQTFDFTEQGFGVCKVFYLRDPDGTVLELLEDLE